MGFRTVADTHFVQNLFRRFYESSYSDAYVQSEIGRREFGYMPFGHKVMVRHLSFKSFEELRRTLAAPISTATADPWSGETSAMKLSGSAVMAAVKGRLWQTL